VSNPQMIECRVSTVSGVESSSVMISWMGPGGDAITNDSRVTISPTSSSGNNYSSSIQFTYLVEGDNGTYACDVMILETEKSASVVLETLISKFNISPDNISMHIVILGSTHSHCEYNHPQHSDSWSVTNTGV